MGVGVGVAVYTFLPIIRSRQLERYASDNMYFCKPGSHCQYGSANKTGETLPLKQPDPDNSISTTVESEDGKNKTRERHKDNVK